MDLSVGTYNILHGMDYPHKLETGEEVIDLSLAANAIRSLGLDICALNEVRNQEHVEGLCNQAKAIAEQLGFHYVFAKAIDHLGGEYGNALVTRYPIISAKCVPIVVPQEARVKGRKYEDRVLLCADLAIDGKTVTVLVTHFGLSEDEMEKAIEVVKDAVKACPHPLMLMGDFNFTPDTPYYSALCEILTDTAGLLQGDGFTFPNPVPKKKIDYLFTNDGCEATAVSIPPILTSDHRPYTATIHFT